METCLCEGKQGWKQIVNLSPEVTKIEMNEVLFGDNAKRLGNSLKAQS
jgi:hypothetical protein